ncbi:hypothetical protein TrST_g4115 [Triparma strigata]|uniref:Uncharacterized protein n=1 Tax=Triparma strigata TaxID=1606541 RepID=A0A9W7ARS5_9STRA|nr:hypothetical protein TrST_g4115 [Triparma strigata]
MGCSNSKDPGLLDEDMMDVMDNHEKKVRNSIVKKDSARLKKRGTFKVEQSRGGMKKKAAHELRIREPGEMKEAPAGIPTLVNWVLTPEGAVLGEVFEGLKNGDYHEGELIQTSEIAMGQLCEEWKVVETESGSKYFLGINDTDELPQSQPKERAPSPAQTKAPSPVQTGGASPADEIIPPPLTPPPARTRVESEAALLDQQKEKVEKAAAKRAQIEAAKKAKEEEERAKTLALPAARRQTLGNEEEKKRWAKNREMILNEQAARIAAEKAKREQYELERERNMLMDIALTKEAQGVKSMTVGVSSEGHKYVIPEENGNAVKPKRIKPSEMMRNPSLVEEKGPME